MGSVVSTVDDRFDAIGEMLSFSITVLDHFSKAASVDDWIEVLAEVVTDIWLVNSTE